MTDLISTTVLLTPYQAFQAKKWHLQNIEEHNLIQKKDLNIRPECFHRFPQWAVPTSDEVKELWLATGMTQKQVSRYLGLKDTNGRAFRRFISGESSITYAYWVLLSLYVGIEKFW